MKKRSLAIFMLLVSLLISGCGGASVGSMTKLDKKFNKYAMSAAKDFLKQEANSYNTVKVKTGELEYEYTLHNEEQDLYMVHYLAKFDADNVEEDEWIEIYVTITGKTKSVQEVDCSYWSVDTYEFSYGQVPDCTTSKQKDWYNINLSAEQLAYYKELNN